METGESKRLQRLYDQVLQSQNNCRWEDLDALLIGLGFGRRQPRRGGSHYTYTRGTLRITVPKARPVKRTYVRAVLKLLE